jgi:hypothetical protein
MPAPELLDAIGVPLSPGQRVVYATAGIHASGFLTPGTITRVSVVEKREGVGATDIVNRAASLILFVTPFDVQAIYQP